MTTIAEDTVSFEEGMGHHNIAFSKVKQLLFIFQIPLSAGVVSSGFVLMMIKCILVQNLTLW